MHYFARMQQSSEQHLLSTAQAAELLGLDRSTVTRKAARGVLPYVVKVPGTRGSYLFDAEVIAKAHTAAAAAVPIIAVITVSDRRVPCAVTAGEPVDGVPVWHATPEDPDLRREEAREIRTEGGMSTDAIVQVRFACPHIPTGE